MDQLFLLRTVGEGGTTLPVTETATVVLVASLLITAGWLAHLYS